MRLLKKIAPPPPPLPKLPRGYRWVSPMEVIVKGDRWLNSDTGKWQLTPCHFEQMHKTYTPGRHEYIRKI